MKPQRRDWVSLVFAVVISYAGIVLAESTVAPQEPATDQWQVVAAPVPLP